MPPTLSPRETEILGLVADGLTSKAIAARLGISESTVNWHLSNALRKLGASSRAAAVATAMRDGPLGTTSPPPRARSAPLPRWQVLLATVTTLLLATPLVIAASLLTMGEPATGPARTEEPARPSASTVASPRASSTTIPAGSSASTPPATTASVPIAGPSPRSGPVAATPSAQPTAEPTAEPTAQPTATVTGLPAPIATPALPSPLTTPALATPALPSPLASPALATPALPVPGPTLVPSIPTLPSVP